MNIFQVMYSIYFFLPGVFIYYKIPKLWPFNWIGLPLTSQLEYLLITWAFFAIWGIIPILIQKSLQSKVDKEIEERGPIL